MKKNQNSKRNNLPVAPIAGASVGLFSLTLVAGTIGLNTTTTSADTSFTDDVSITVSAVCNIASTLDTAHTATITPGLAFTENIGTTNVSATCNDSDGYSIYAVGYTGNTIGNTNLEGTNTGNTGINIATRSYDSSYTDTSYWSMKLTAGQGTDAATIIDSPINYSNYVAVPNAYDKVATKTSATTGSSEASFTTTYGAYATTTQTAGNYAGKVKYTLVHPHNDAPITDNQIKVVYDGNGSFFDQAGTKSKNTVIYEEAQTGTGKYIATTPTIVKSANVNNDGTKATAYTSDVNEFIPFTVSGASKLKVMMDYGVSNGTGLAIATGNWDGTGEPDVIVNGGDMNSSGTETYVFEGDTITFNLINFSGSAPSEGYDYGFYARVYPIYDTEQAGTEEITITESAIAPVGGAYANAPDNRIWTLETDGNTQVFTSEAQVIQYLNENKATLMGETVVLRADNINITVEYYSCWDGSDTCGITFTNGTTKNTVVYGYDNLGDFGITNGTYEQFWSTCNRYNTWSFEGQSFCDESGVKEYLDLNKGSLKGTTIKLYYVQLLG